MTLTEAPVDGRAARRDRNRQAVLDAALELFGEGVLEPTPEQVAERSGVSLRSVYRYFDDRDELVRAAIERRLETVRPLAEVPDLGEGSRRERIERLVAARLRLHAEVGPTARASRHKARTSPLLADTVARTHRELREQVEAQLAPELARLAPPEQEAVLAAADVLLQLEGLDHLVEHRRFTAEQARRSLCTALDALLATGERTGGPR